MLEAPLSEAQLSVYHDSDITYILIPLLHISVISSSFSLYYSFLWSFPCFSSIETRVLRKTVTSGTMKQLNHYL